VNSYSVTLILCIFLLGVSIGSFLNVFIFRMGSGMRLSGRSKCLSCGKQLTFLMLIPLASFLALRGRCGHCRAKLSLQYPLVEAVTGVLFALVAIKNGLVLQNVLPVHLLTAVLEALIWSVLVVVFVYDVKHKIIPDRLSLLFAITAGVLLYIKGTNGLIVMPYLPFLDVVPSWIDWAAAPLVSIPLALIWFVTGGRGMGLGDAKLAWGIGWFLGFGAGVSAIVLSFWIAFFPSLALLFLRGKQFTMKSEIPFAPFLIIGTFVAYAFGVDILSWTF
jgi:leader peptidase (prepilin peptidase)/N-methyltransferase